MSCEEMLSGGRARPRVEETFPLKASAGYRTDLTVVVHHLPGERVLPAGLELESSSEEGKSLEEARFFLPAPESETQATIVRDTSPDKNGEIRTTVTVPFIPLPPKAGRETLTLPKLPLDFARASGTVDRLCTDAHVITVEDPLASAASHEAAADPPPRPQAEVWETARDVVAAFLVALPVVLLVGFLLYRLLPKLKKPTKAAPPIPPWETALRELREIEEARLLERQEFEAHLDRVSDTMRAYLGSRYGFDGLESTTKELLRLLAEKAPDFPFEREVRTILQRTDLVKFARRPPIEDECREAFEETYRIVQKTTPAPSLDPRLKGAGDAPSKRREP